MSFPTPGKLLAALLVGAGVSMVGPVAKAVPVVQTAPVSGTYSGLLKDANGRALGTARVVLTNGHGSAAVRIGNDQPCVVLIGVGPGGAITIGRIGDPDMSIQLNLDTTTTPPRVVGTVTDDGTTFPVTLTPPATLESVASLAGSYTFVLNSGGKSPITPNPVAGVAAARVSRTGAFSLISALSGSVISQGGRLNADNRLEFFLRTKDGSTGGTINFGTNASPSGTARRTRGQVSVDLLIAGSHYDRAGKFTSSENWVLTAQGQADDGTNAQIAGLATVAGGNGLRVSGTSSAAVTTLPLSGVVVGRYQTLVNGKPVVRQLLGVALQDYGIAVGAALKGMAVAGDFQITPASAGLGLNPVLNFGNMPTSIAPGPDAGFVKTGVGSLVLNEVIIIGPIEPIGGGGILLPNPGPIIPPTLPPIIYNPPVFTTPITLGGTFGTSTNTSGVITSTGTFIFSNPTNTTGNLIIATGSAAPLRLNISASTTLNLVSSFFASLATKQAPTTLTLPEGLTVTIGGPMPTGWQLTQNGVVVEPGTFQVVGDTGTGSPGTFVFAPVPADPSATGSTSAGSITLNGGTLILNNSGLPAQTGNNTAVLVNTGITTTAGLTKTGSGVLIINNSGSVVNAGTLTTSVADSNAVLNTTDLTGVVRLNNGVISTSGSNTGAVLPSFSPKIDLQTLLDKYHIPGVGSSGASSSSANQ